MRKASKKFPVATQAGAGPYSLEGAIPLGQKIKSKKLEAERDAMLERHQVLLRQKRLGKITSSEKHELEQIQGCLKAEPAPTEFESARASLANDRIALRKSTEHIKRLLESPT